MLPRAVLPLTLVLLAAMLGPVACGAGAPEGGYTSAEVIEHFERQTGTQLFRRATGGDPAWDQLGFPENASPKLVKRYGVFTIYVVKPGREEALASLLSDKATKEPLQPRQGVYWELDTLSEEWIAYTRYGENVVLVWFGGKAAPATDLRWQRLHRALADLPTGA